MHLCAIIILIDGEVVIIINFFKRILGKIIVPSSLINDDPKLVHISDTPSFTYVELVKMIKTIQPKYVVHTGDISDDIKLELYPWKLDLYESNIKRLSYKLRNIASVKMYFCVGNHDNTDVLKKYFGNEAILESPTILEIDGTCFSISHYYDQLIRNNCRFFLFGHNVNHKSSVEGGKFYLNGIQGINIINLRTKEITSLGYPIGTDDSRQRKLKIGM